MLGAWIILGVLVIGLLLVERVRGKISLAHYKRELNAAGIRLSPAEFLPKPAPNEDNSAPELWTVFDQLPKDTITTTNTPPKMRLLPSGRAVVCFREDFWADDQNTNRWNEVADELVNNQEKLKQIQALLRKPLLRNRLDYEAGPKMLFTHVMFGLEEFLGKDESEQVAWKKIVASIPGGDEVIKFLKHQVYTRIWRFAWLDQDEEYHGLYGWQAVEVPSELRRPIPFVFCWRRRTGR